MNNPATIEKMQEMRLNGMMKAFSETFATGMQNKFTVDEIVSHLIDAEWDERYNRKFNALVKNAAFRYKASMEEIDFSPIRKIDKNLVLRLSTCDWIRKGESIIITGSTGGGKSFMSCALGHKACISRYKVGYYNCMKLFSHLKYSRADGTYFKEMNKIKKQDLVILDDFGLKPLDADSRLMLLELLEDRHGRKSIIITSQISIDKWFDLIGDATIADAICDRLFHTSHKINIEGPSMREKKVKNSGRNLPLK
ncbi:MAG TPA: IS21-like element helper ATPase IstB [Spirochaetota bacterium]|nr:IS21-like element helper ATPase IstB [Spirochaetota bacterium]